MSVANVLFDVLAPVAIIIVLGAVFGPRLKADVGTLSRLAYWVFGPALVFSLLADAELEGSVVLKLVAAAVAGMVAALVFGVIWARAIGASFDVTAAVAMTSAYGNVGNMGLAIVIFALGEGASAAAGVLMVTINLLGLIIGVALAQARTTGPAAALLRGITAPMSIAGVVALVINFAGIDLPQLVLRSVELMGDGLIPVMLFTLGLQLVQSGRPTWSSDLLAIIVAKLAIAPLVAAAVGSAIGLAGDNLDAVIIQSAMPPAVFCAVVAIENDLVPDKVTAAVVLTTLASVISLPIMLLLVG